MVINFINRSVCRAAFSLNKPVVGFNPLQKKAVYNAFFIDFRVVPGVDLILELPAEMKNSPEMCNHRQVSPDHCQEFTEL